MKQAQLKLYLEQLRAAVASVEASAQDKQHLSEVIAAVEAAMNDAVTDDDNLRKQLQLLVAGFERDHPGLVVILNNIILTLGNMGV